MSYNSEMASRSKRRIGPRLGRQSLLLKQSTLNVRMTDEQLREMQQQAAALDLSVSTWARMILMREIKNDRDR